MTELVYLENTYLFGHNANVQGFGSDERGQYCLLDKTIFYPQGGGQPSDTGTITIGDNTIQVVFAGYIDGKVRHYGDFDAVTDAIDQQAKLSVNSSRRLINAKAHTAGHLIQCVIEEIDHSLKAVKGYHFPDGSYVEFSGTSTMEAQERIEKANIKLKEIVDQKVDNSTRLVSKDELAKLCPDLPYDVPEHGVRS